MKKGKIDLAKLKFGILVLLILVFVTVYILATLKGYGIFDEIQKFVVSNPKLSPVIFTGLFVVSAFFPLPLLTIFGSTIFGFWEVFVCSLIGHAINAMIVFYLARWLGRDFVKSFEKKHKTAKKLDLTFKKNGFRDIILLRFFYPIPVEIGNLAGGLSGMKVRDYFWGTMIGMTPVLVASILVVKGELLDNNLMLTIATILLILLIIMPLLYLSAAKKFSKQKYKEVKESTKEFVGLKK